MTDLEKIANGIRRRILRMASEARAPHIGSGLSCVEILVVLYFEVARLYPERPISVKRDRIILSKGHAALTQYACLAERGFFPTERLSEFARENSTLAEHPSLGAVPGIECTTGSLGHGLGIGTGIALSLKRREIDARVFVILSDGECNEGSTWESALWAPKQGLDNLVAIVDFNRLQATGRSTEITSLEPLADKWRSFGWETLEVDGHDPEALSNALRQPPSGGIPRALIAHTIKGKGVSFMEDDVEWHYRPPTQAELADALAELEEAAR